MLLQKSGYDTGDIATFKLANGDEIVAKVLEDSAQDFVIERPCTVVPSQKGIMLIASLFTADTDIKVTLHKNHVLLHAPTVKEVQNYYIQVTTGIQPVNGGSLVTGV